MGSEWNIPEGFEAVYLYPDGKEENKVLQEGVLRLKGSYHLTFQCFVRKEVSGKTGKLKTKQVLPTLPFKRTGEIWHEGWDIPTRYVIDGKEIVWMDNAHGGYLQMRSMKDLILEGYKER